MSGLDQDSPSPGWKLTGHLCEVWWERLREELWERLREGLWERLREVAWCRWQRLSEHQCLGLSGRLFPRWWGHLLGEWLARLLQHLLGEWLAHLWVARWWADLSAKLAGLLPVRW